MYSRLRRSNNTRSEPVSSTALSFCPHGDNSNEEPLLCECGEEQGLSQRKEWTLQKADEFDNSYVQLSDCHTQVKFIGPTPLNYQVAIGSHVLEEGMHHFWEIKITSSLYGCRLSLGVLDRETKYYYVLFDGGSLCSSSKQGSTYYGNSVATRAPDNRKIDAVFAKGSIIGIHLDLTRGTMEYTINHQRQGIAFTDLKGKSLVPCILGDPFLFQSISAKLVSAVSLPHTLQFESALAITKMYVYDTLSELPAHVKHVLLANFWPLFPRRAWIDPFIAINMFGDDCLEEEGSKSTPSKSETVEKEPILATKEPNTDELKPNRPATKSKVASLRSTNKIESDYWSSDDEFLFLDTRDLKKKRAQQKENSEENLPKPSCSKSHQSNTKSKSQPKIKDGDNKPSAAVPRKKFRLRKS
eukprot:TRINITY_DN5129_c0_g1_i13.p1 TRINITY_DN5129_c0_g1~~TRINITY_DN5129_c0_g1_i13.p1  ORF type:complete len:413 (-),score=53.15 TRINITY_DN5129_c0_g1_i13:193-1431(-)